MSLTRVEAGQRFRTLMQLRREAEAKVIELLQHPDTTVDELVAANKAAVNVNRHLRRAVTVLRKRWTPQTDDARELLSPWNRREYDCYDERLTVYKKVEETNENRRTTNNEQGATDQVADPAPTMGERT